MTQLNDELPRSLTERPRQDKRIELKYMLDANLSAAVKQWARQHLGVDQYCNDTLVDSYEVNTLYLDTPELDLFHRSGVVGRTKHRVRRYGNESTLWLESKRKKGNVVRKSRTAGHEDEVLSRLPDRSSDSPWCGSWFSDRIVARRLQPAVQVHYRRFARTSTLDGENLRLTIDSHLQASPTQGWNVASADGDMGASERITTSDSEILELKFHNRMPSLFKQLLRTFAIPATGFSKYRTSIDVWNPVEATDFPSDCFSNNAGDRLSNV